VLSSLPSARPQRPSARRAAARQQGRRTAPTTAPATDRPLVGATVTDAVMAPQRTSETPDASNGAKRARRGKAKSKADAKPTTPGAQAPAIPPQGFEAESEIEPGVPVAPPSGQELAGAVVELVGELAQAGLASGGRLLRDALGRLPGV
jgi:hypothetical protein